MPSEHTYLKYATGLSLDQKETQPSFAQSLSHFSCKKIIEIDAVNRVVFALDLTKGGHQVEDKPYSFDFLVIDPPLQVDTSFKATFKG